jgi:hypothetical protein
MALLIELSFPALPHTHTSLIRVSQIALLSCHAIVKVSKMRKPSHLNTHPRPPRHLFGREADSKPDRLTAKGWWRQPTDFFF